MYIDLDGAGDGARRGRVDVRGAPPAVPEVGRRVFVRDSKESELCIILSRVDADAGLGVVF